MANIKNILKESLKNFNKQVAADREALAVDKIAYYDYDYIILREKLKQFITRTDKDIPYTMTNLTQKIINRKSMVYKKPPVRVVEGDDNDIYNDITKDKDSSMKVTERQTNLLGRTGHGVLWDKEKEIFKYNILQYFIPLKMKNGVVTEMMYPLNKEKSSNRLWVYWSEEYHLVIHQSGKPAKDQEQYGITDTEFKNDYKIVPYTYPYDKQPIGGFWNNGAEDVVRSNEQINVLLSTLNFLDRYASFKQAYIKGQGLKKQNIEFGYNKLIKLETSGDDGSELGVLDITADLDQKINNIKYQVELLLHNNDMAGDVGGSGSATSGFHLIVKNIDLLTLWDDQIPIWRKHENDIYEIERKVYEVESSKSALPEKMHVNYAEVRFPVSPEEQRAKDDWDLEKGLTTLLDIAKRENPDADEKELKKKLAEATPKTPPRPTLANLAGGL